MRLTSIDLVAFIAPIIGYLLFGWRGALFAVALRSELKIKF